MASLRYAVVLALLLPRHVKEHNAMAVCLELSFYYFSLKDGLQV